MSQENDLPGDSLLPYDAWTEEATREVMLRALEHAVKHGLPGEHHFYITFITTAAGVNIPGHLRARYPEEMTIVLQHQYWDLKVDRAARVFSVGLSFGQVPSTLIIPFAAITAFWDPAVRVGLRFSLAPRGQAAAEPAIEAASPTAALPAPTGTVAAVDPAEPEAAKPQVISLDAFRRKPARD